MAGFAAFSGLKIKTLQSEGEYIDVRDATLPEERPEDDGFDPRDHRNPRAVIRPYMAYFNLLRTCFGVGMVGIPMAVSQVGIILGPLMVIFTGFLIHHTHLMLLNCLNEICRQLKISFIPYRYGFRMALLHGPPILHCLGEWGPNVVAFFMVLSQLGICTLYVVFTSDNLRDIMDWETNEPALMALFIPYLLLEISMKNLKVVSYISMMGNVINFVNLILVIYAIFKDPRGELELLPAGSAIISVFICLGTLLFNMSVIGIMLSCERALSKPKLMSDTWGVVNVGILFPTFFSTILGILGYWSFGVMEENVLRYLPFDEATSIANFGLYLVAVGLTYPIQCYPGVQIFCEIIKNHDPLHTPTNASIKQLEFIMRPIFVLTTFLIAYAVPFQCPLVAFVGHMCTTFLALIFPAMMDIGIRYPYDYGTRDYILIKDVLIIILGLVSFTFGTILSGFLIYIRLMSYESADHEYL